MAEKLSIRELVLLGRERERADSVVAELRSLAKQLDVNSHVRVYLNRAANSYSDAVAALRDVELLSAQEQRKADPVG